MALHGTRGKFREEMKVFLFEAAKKRQRDQRLDHTMSDGIWKEIDPNDVRFTDYDGILPNVYELDAGHTRRLTSIHQAKLHLCSDTRPMTR